MVGDVEACHGGSGPQRRGQYHHRDKTPDQQIRCGSRCYQHRHDKHNTRSLNPYYDNECKHYQEHVVNEVGTRTDNLRSYGVKARKQQPVVKRE